MAAIWTDEGKLDRWLASRSPSSTRGPTPGALPVADAEKVRKARYNIADVARYQAETHHDVTAFLKSVADSLGEEGRWVHLGLTSQDVWDTATALQLRDSATLLEDGLHALREVLERRAVEFKDTLCIGRTHGVHAEPTTFGLKLAGWVAEIRRAQGRLAEAKAQIAVRQDQRRRRLARHRAAGHRREGLHQPRARRSSRSARRSCRATATRYFISTLAIIAASLERMAQEIRHLQRTEVLEAEEPFERGPDRLQRDAAQAQPGAVRARLRPRARDARLRADVVRERRALARARHLALVDRAHHAAGLVRPARLHARHLHRRRARPQRLPGAHAPEPRADAGPRVLAARDARADRHGPLAAGRVRHRAAQRDARVEGAHALPRPARSGRRRIVAPRRGEARRDLRLQRLHAHVDDSFRRLGLA